MSKKKWFHLAVRAAWTNVSLLHPEVAPRLWRQLRRSFPEASAACLMDRHVHVSAKCASRREARARMGAWKSGVSRSLGLRIRWEGPTEPEAITTPQIHRRVDRYVILNPNRAGLVDDPLIWPWSTLRDVLGATTDPWVDPARLAPLHGDRLEGFAARFHRYVARDETVTSAGALRPLFPGRQLSLSSSLVSLVAVALVATRSSPAALLRASEARTLFLALAFEVGIADTQTLCRICGVDRKTLSRHRRGAPPRGLAAARLGLADSRLWRRLETEVTEWLATRVAPEAPWGAALRPSE